MWKASNFKDTHMAAKPTTILAIDTSTGPSSIALWQDGKILGYNSDPDGQQQSRRLMVRIETLVGKDYSALTALAVCTGPGGFTGIRVGLAAARGIALAADLPLIGVSSLQALAWEILGDALEGKSCTAWVNAYREQAYIETFTRTPSGLTSIRAAEAVTIGDFPAYIAQFPDAAHIGTMPLPDAKPHYHRIAPDAPVLAEFAAFLLATGQTGLGADYPAEACYIRPPDAKPQSSLIG